MDSRSDLEAWNEAAGEYIRRIGFDGDTFYRRFAEFMHRQLGDLKDLSVLDLGCGHGWLAAKLRQQGAGVVGIDGSRALITAARREHPGVEFRIHDLTSGLPSLHRSFDRIVSHMVLMDLADVDRLIHDVASVLAPDGVFVFSILHPSFFGSTPALDPTTGVWSRRVDGYLDHERRHITSFGGHTHYHRPLTWYVDRLTASGLAITGLDEPRTLPQIDKPETDWTDYERWFATIPTMLAVACRPLTPPSP